MTSLRNPQSQPRSPKGLWAAKTQSSPETGALLNEATPMEDSAENRLRIKNEQARNQHETAHLYGQLGEPWSDVFETLARLEVLADEHARLTAVVEGWSR
jgi:hypothetical protein